MAFREGIRTDATLGIVGLPAPVAELAARSWDAIVVGAGHNGLTCAAYLARAGKRVLVLEARKRVGGACTIEAVWPGYRISPCAYLAGLLHPLVIEELDLPGHGFEWIPATAGMFVPFDDGQSIQLWDDEGCCDAEIRRLAPRDLAGWHAMGDVKRRLRDAIRPSGARDLWIGRAPSLDEIEARLDGDEEARKLLFEWSMVEFVERYLSDERLQSAMLGQGVIGTNASPHDAGTASIHFHHVSGRMGGGAGLWGYVKGGMGTISFLLCDIAREAGAVVAAGLPVARIVPGRGVELEGGERIDAPCVVSNADPRATLRMLGDQADPAWQARVEAIPIVGCTVKLNVALRELPSFRARPGTRQPHHLGQVNTPLSKTEWRLAHQAAREGRLPERLWTELYFQTAHDASVAPEGVQTMSVFAQYVPYSFAEGSWETRRDEVGALALGSIARYCENLPEAVLAMEVLGPPDIEAAVGLTGGHIFQGECLPPYMWSHRLESRTPMPGLFLCGACTHPGGSVIAINGRNAAMEILGAHQAR
ncbi:phytoene desaturase family protein [Singulisphaera acidiphila]|uniref:Phytoene dehydrogenase-like oxidoreductase n=1 Tax=Singulisphaera acidiphila (strain ATCC BAA-1392 / DSM 18658 / VKM B-2454 / MOB10) TaxID=886293 RepID=L0DI34_SINAD|nr:NAD(P)/FAD-dependent oxidoreductase [Singulisphaera acidiphila]AGA29054.1 phytoene dehydrogenase-like oxidoreductase [Singulisphaera acidiphila DSM 18658]